MCIRDSLPDRLMQQLHTSRKIISYDVTDKILPMPGARQDVYKRQALQKAIDECHRSGGGTVEVAPGYYRIGGIRQWLSAEMCIRDRLWAVWYWTSKVT